MGELFVKKEVRGEKNTFKSFGYKIKFSRSMRGVDMERGRRNLGVILLNGGSESILKI